ncbi:integrase core domain-containing protein, partial [Rhodovulum sulfidophilum]|uniref:integrase core domain-containing protein n=1 Tax=Rhodovulum sulfidophilum TaxID=35806 RepID=UPI003B226ED7
IATPVGGLVSGLHRSAHANWLARCIRNMNPYCICSTTPLYKGPNGDCESFNSTLRDELLNGEIIYALAEARVVIETWRVHYNTARLHSSLGYKPPAPAAVQGSAPPSGAAPPTNATVVPRSVMH